VARGPINDNEWDDDDEEAEDKDPEDKDTWTAIDLRSVVKGLLAGTVTKLQPTVGRMTDGKCLFYMRYVNTVFGESGDGKTLLLLYVCAQEIALGHYVGFFDYEDDESGIVERMLDFGADPEALVEYFHYFRPDEYLSKEASERITKLIRRTKMTLVVIDSAGESLAMEEQTSNDEDAVAEWNRRFPKMMASLGPAVVTTDHVTKDPGSRRGYAIGSHRKRATVTGAGYEMICYLEFGKGFKGAAKLVCRKDKRGNYRRHQQTASFTVDATIEPTFSPKGVTDPYDVSLDHVEYDEMGVRPTRYMEKASIHVEAHPGCSQNSVLNGIEAVTTKQKAMGRKAIDRLIGEGYVRPPEEGVRNSKLYYSIKPYRQVDDPKGPTKDEWEPDTEDEDEEEESRNGQLRKVDFRVRQSEAKPEKPPKLIRRPSPNHTKDAG
jgi:hypothetical protein